MDLLQPPHHNIPTLLFPEALLLKRNKMCIVCQRNAVFGVYNTKKQQTRLHWQQNFVILSKKHTFFSHLTSNGVCKLHTVECVSVNFAKILMV